MADRGRPFQHLLRSRRHSAHGPYFPSICLNTSIGCGLRDILSLRADRHPTRSFTARSLARVMTLSVSEPLFCIGGQR
jgi:hypothetical protein